MKKLRRICAGLILTLALTLTAFGGEITNPPGPMGDTQFPGVAGETQFPGAGGEIGFPGVAGEIGFPGLGLLFALLFS